MKLMGPNLLSHRRLFAMLGKQGSVKISIAKDYQRKSLETLYVIGNCLNCTVANNNLLTSLLLVLEGNVYIFQCG